MLILRREVSIIPLREIDSGEDLHFNLLDPRLLEEIGDLSIDPQIYAVTNRDVLCPVQELGLGESARQFPLEKAAKLFHDIRLINVLSTPKFIALNLAGRLIHL